MVDKSHQKTDWEKPGAGGMHAGLHKESEDARRSSHDEAAEHAECVARAE